jgi:transposase
MSAEKKVATRFIGLDVHKHYLIAVGVDAQLNEVFGPVRVPLPNLLPWAQKNLAPEDAVVLEMTTNAFQLYDDLVPYAGAVTLVHPPHVALITRARVMTDKIAARLLARLLVAGLLPPVWVPPQEVRDRRALLAQRTKLVRLATQAKNRLHSTLHRYHLAAPAGDPFAPAQRPFWRDLPVTPLEQVRLQSDLATLAFAQTQVAALEETLAGLAAQDDRVPLLIQLPGISLVSAMTILAALGDVTRFPDAAHLVGYAGFGVCVHDSGQTRRTGRITKAGRRDLRFVLVEAAQTAVNTHPHWQAELERLEPRLGRNKAIVAIARKLLVAVWHVLTAGCADRYAEPERVARKLLTYTYTLGKENRPQGQTAAVFVREQLDRLDLGADLAAVPRGKRPVPLPPSKKLDLKVPAQLTIPELVAVYAGGPLTTGK